MPSKLLAALGQCVKIVTRCICHKKKTEHLGQSFAIRFELIAAALQSTANPTMPLMLSYKFLRAVTSKG